MNRRLTSFEQNTAQSQSANNNDIWFCLDQLKPKPVKRLSSPIKLLPPRVPLVLPSALLASQAHTPNKQTPRAQKNKPRVGSYVKVGLGVIRIPEQIGFLPINYDERLVFQIPFSQPQSAQQTQINQTRKSHFEKSNNQLVDQNLSVIATRSLVGRPKSIKKETRLINKDTSNQTENESLKPTNTPSTEHPASCTVINYQTSRQNQMQLPTLPNSTSNSKSLTEQNTPVKQRNRTSLAHKMLIRNGFIPKQNYMEQHIINEIKVSDNELKTNQQGQISNDADEFYKTQKNSTFASEPFNGLPKPISTPPHTSVKAHRYPGRTMEKIRFNLMKNTFNLENAEVFVQSTPSKLVQNQNFDSQVPSVSNLLPAPTVGLQTPKKATPSNNQLQKDNRILLSGTSQDIQDSVLHNSISLINQENKFQQCIESIKMQRSVTNTPFNDFDKSRKLDNMQQDREFVRTCVESNVYINERSVGKEIEQNIKSCIVNTDGPINQLRQAVQMKKRYEQSWQKLTSIIAKQNKDFQEKKCDLTRLNKNKTPKH